MKAPKIKCRNKIQKGMRREKKRQKRGNSQEKISDGTTKQDFKTVLLNKNNELKH